MFARIGVARVGLLLAAAAAAVAGCSSSGNSAAPPPSGTAAGSASASGTPPTSATPSAPALPAVCSDVLPLIDLDTALGSPLVGRTEQIQGVPEPKINRTGRITCRFGVVTDPRTKKAGAPKIEVGVSTYTDDAAAKDRVETTVVGLRGDGASPHPVKANGLDATVLTGAGVGTFVVATGNRTIVITLAPRVVPGARTIDALTKVGELALKNIPQ
jgi:hypothetical protein